MRARASQGMYLVKLMPHHIGLCPDVLQNTVQMPYPQLAVLGSDGRFHIGIGEEQGREMGRVKNVNVKMDGRMVEAALPQPVQQRRAVPDNVPAGDDVQLPFADGGILMGQYAVNAHKGHLFRPDRPGHFGRQQGFAFAQQIAQHHGMGMVKIPGGGNVRMGINPDDGQVARVQLIEIAEGGLADEAVSPEGDDAPGRMLPDDFLCGSQLPQDFLAVEDASVPGGGAVCLRGRHGNFHQGRRTLRRQPGQQACTQGVDLPGEGGFVIAALPLRKDKTEQGVCCLGHGFFSLPCKVFSGQPFRAATRAGAGCQKGRAAGGQGSGSRALPQCGRGPERACDGSRFRTPCPAAEK